MSQPNIARKQLTKGEVLAKTSKRGKPEVHIHTAITFVWPADPFGLEQDSRTQLEHEFGQFAARLKYGLIDGRALDQAFNDFKQVVQHRLRETGALVEGQ